MRAAIAAIGLAGCFDPHAPAGAPCAPDRTCPAPLVCARDVCVPAAGDDATQAAVDARGPLGDTAPLDAPPPTIDAAAGPWVVLHTADQEDAPTVAIPPTQAGDTLIVALETNLVSPAGVTDSQGDALALVPGSAAADHAQGTGVEVWTVANVRAGATSVSVAPAGPGHVYSIAVWEVANLRATNAIDAVAAVSDQNPTTLANGAEVATTQRGDFVLGIAIVANTVTMLANGGTWTGDLGTHGNGWAHLSSQAAAPGTYRPRWRQSTSGTYCATTVAFFAAFP